MPGTKDHVLELISIIESQGFSYVVAIVLPDRTNKNNEKIDIYSNLGEQPLDKLLNVLQEYKKSLPNKIKNDKIKDKE